MSTLPSQASKGEKTKPKFQFLDINSLYRNSRGENLEKTQQKSSSTYIKHGMQSLGKVPNARRAPANLPSLKSEHSGTDAAVPLVPPGASGWGKQDPSSAPTSSSNNSPSTTTTSTVPTPVTNPNTPSGQPQLTPHQAAIALPVTTTIPPQQKHSTPSVPTATTDKLWSSVMSGQEPLHHPPPYQSPQFQHEFPSLSAGDGGPTRTGSDAPYPSGLSLRPQTEGSWTQGGARPGIAEVTAPRPGSAPLGAPPQLSAQVGQQPLPPQFQSVMPSFMYKGNFTPSGVGIPNQNATPALNGRNRPENRPPRTAEPDEITPRPIIKEEELNRMDEIGTDLGWAGQDDIDYNQKLAFSDDESDRKPNRKEPLKSQQSDHERSSDNNSGHHHENQNRNSWTRSSSTRGRSDDEEWIQQCQKVIDDTMQRAKLRKEEEEKRYSEGTMQAHRKLLELEEKISKRDQQNQDNVKTSSKVTIDSQKDKERDSRSRTPNDTNEDKNTSTNRDSNNFRLLTQIEGKSFPRKHAKPERDGRDRDRDIREQNGPSFSRHFQNDLPPRFKHQRSNMQSQQQQQQQQPLFQYENRWSTSNPSAKQSNNRNIRQESPERDLEDERRDYKRQSSEDSYRSSHHSQSDMSQKISDNTASNRHSDEFSRRDPREKDDDKWHREKDRSEKRLDYQQQDDWHDRREKTVREEKPQDRYERPQRPDSRDSRSTRDSRHSRDSEPRDYIGSWNESSYESSYEDKRRDHVREDRRQVPGPITKERIEADDMRNEKRNLTQLKRGHLIEKKTIDIKKEEKQHEEDADKKLKDTHLDNSGNNTSSTAWADSIPSGLDQAESSLDKSSKHNSNLDIHKAESGKHTSSEMKKSEVDYKDRNRNRIYPQNKSWNSSSNEYHRSSAWPKRQQSRGHKSSSTTGRPSSSVSGEFHGTDSEGSLDEHCEVISQRSPKPFKKIDKEEKNRDNKQEKLKTEKRDNYVPRGEPSRHGRGGGNTGNFRSSRVSGLSKRIDGYGPPPSKSPFGGHHDDKEKKVSGDEGTADYSSEEKTKQNQQALSAGLSGNRKDQFDKFDDKNKPRKPDHRRGKSKSKNEGKKDDDICDTNSENSDEKDGNKIRKSANVNKQSSNATPVTVSRSNSSISSLSRRNTTPAPRLGNDKRYEPTRTNERSSNIPPRQNSNVSLSSKKDEKSNEQNLLCNAIADISLSIKNRDETDLNDDKDEKSSFNGDSEGFQEVKSKKTVKERQKSVEEKQPVKQSIKEKDIGINKGDRKKAGSATQLTQQQIQNIPSLMATPINPPPIMTQPKNQFERPRQNKLAPRFAKQKLQKAQMQQQHGICDVGDINKVNQSINVYGLKDGSGVAPVSSCAWDKPLGSQIRNLEHESMLGVSSGIDSVKGLDQSQATSQGTSPNHDKLIGKTNQLQDKTLLDGTTPPVNTIIFENTNFKSAPGSRSSNSRNDKPRSKLEESAMDNSVINFNKPMSDLLNKNDKQSDPMQIPLSFKEDNADMKLDFFSSDLSHLTDEKPKSYCMPKTVQAITSGNSTICTADSLNIKIASVKKVWETPTEHSVGQDDTNTSFSNSFVPDSNSLDPNNVFSKGNDTPDDSHEGYSPSPNQTASTTTNVCKVKPTQQVSGSSGQTVLSSTNHQQHSGIVAPSLMGNPLSPPPMQPVIGAGVGIGQPPQQYSTNQHIGYQAGLGGSTQYGMSAIPSPPTVPTVLYSSTQQLQAQTGLYGAFQIDQTGVLSGGQSRSQYSQYPNHYNLGQTASSPYSTQSVYLQATPSHPPPPAAQAPPELYTNMNSFRLPGTSPYGQNQQLNNPTTVLISSTSNSLMSASVKPSSQPISAIGTKAGGVGQAYQQQSQQGQQVFMAYDPSIQPNYLPTAGVMQRGPAGPVQNSVVPAMQSSSYYSGSTGGQTGYFPQPGSSTIQSAPLQQHQAGFGLQGNVFGNQSHTNAGLQSYTSHFLSTPIQMAAALNAQQYRSGVPAPYLKGVGSQQIGDQNRPQQLKSPNSQEVLSSVFNSGPQIPSPKSKPNCKHPPPQSSPTAQHKYLYQTMGNHQSGNVQRYPTPIQRPVNFQQSLNVQQNSNANNSKHRSNNPGNKAPNRQYYGSQRNTNTSNSSSNISNKATSLGNSGTPTVVAAAGEIVKDNITKEETSSLKD